MPGHVAHTTASAGASQAGFTLLEVLVVLFIVGLVTGLAGLGLGWDNDARALRDDARRLAQLFPLAQAQARQSGRPVIWQYDESGYRFVQPRPTLLMPAALARHMPEAPLGIERSGPLRARSWSSGRPIAVHLPAAAPAVVFYDEWVSGPRAIELSDGLQSVRLLRTGTGAYQVAP